MSPTISGDRQGSIPGVSDTARPPNGQNATDGATGPDTLPRPEEIAAAKILLRQVKGEDVGEAELGSLPAAPLDWYGLANRAGAVPKEKRAKVVGGDLATIATTKPHEAAVMRHALKIAEQEPPEDPPEPPEPPRTFSLELVDTRTFFEQEFRLDYWAKGLLVKDETCVFGGPQKSLKTSILIDLAISLASGTPFLGRFYIPERVPVALISGESGKAVIQANAKQICIERELPFGLAGNVHWGFTIPKLSEAEHLGVLRKTIGDLGLKVVLLDPLYLMLVSGAAGVDPKDMFQMGPMLAEVAAACKDAGATPVLCHHFVKKREDPYGPPDMRELAYAGIGQFMRQWMLTSRRERYDPESGMHPLHFHYGGSAGHGGELHLDIETGRLDDELKGRRWAVRVMNPRESREARQAEAKAITSKKQTERNEIKEEAKGVEERDLMFRFLEKLRGMPDGRATAKTMRDAIGWGKPKFDRIAYLCRESGAIRESMIPTDMGQGRPPKDYPGYAVAGEVTP